MVLSSYFLNRSRNIGGGHPKVPRNLCRSHANLVDTPMRNHPTRTTHRISRASIDQLPRAHAGSNTFILDDPFIVKPFRRNLS